MGDPSAYLQALGRHPRLDSRGEYSDEKESVKRPRPLEDGNWVCEDPDCANVNYPRRTECNKCGKKRGPVGDTIVSHYVQRIRATRGEGPSVGGAPKHAGPSVGSGGHGGHGRPSPFPSSPSGYNGRSGMSVLPPGPMLSGGYDMPQENSQLREAGKVVADQMIAAFQDTSADPVGDALQACEAACDWLKSLRSINLMNVNPAGSLHPFNPAQAMGGRLGMDLGGPMLGGMGPSMGAGMGPGMDSYGGMHQNARPPPQFKDSRHVKFEDWKDKPSEYLRDYGDPAVTGGGGGSGERRGKPTPGVNGNWECSEPGCRNVNFPRRTNCFQCKKERDEEGERIVREYVRDLIERRNMEQ